MASETATKVHRPVLKSVQALRAVAALFVVLMHMQLPNNGVDVFAQPILAIFRFVGHFGVDLFFAISGFIMLVTNSDWFAQPNASRRFLLHRAIRIYPAYWLSILPIFVAFSFARDHVMPGHVAGRTDLLASFLLYPQPVDHVLLPVSWTLAFEVTFYIIFAAILKLQRRYVVAALGLWFVFQLALWLAFEGSPNPYLEYAATALPMEFIFGALVGVAYVRGHMPAASALLAFGVAGVSAVWVASNVMGHALFTTSMERVICFGVPAAMILYGAVATEARGSLRIPAWLVSLGDASYALYLWHFSLISAARLLVLKLHPVGRVAEVLIIAMTLAGILIFSLAVYRFFEMPVTRALNAFFVGRSSRVTGKFWRLEPMPVVVKVAEE